MDTDQLTVTSMMARPRVDFADRKIVSHVGNHTTQLTYAEFFGRVDKLAWALRSLGIGRGDRVGTMAWNHHRHLELYLAVTMSGAVLHTINVRLSREQVIQVARHADDKVIFCDGDLANLFREARPGLPTQKVVWLGESEHREAGDLDYEDLLAAQSSALFDYPDMPESTPAATSYSSATTGTPKGVVYTHRALYLHSMMLGLADTWAISEADIVMPIVPMFHVNAWGLPFTALWMGAGLVLPGVRPNPQTVLRLMQVYHVTFAAAVPVVWADVLRDLRAQGSTLPSLRLIVSGGAPLPPALLREADELGVPMMHSYGMTEASPLVLVGRRRSDAPATGPELEQLRLRQGSVVPGLQWRVVDSDGHDVQRDGTTPGELRLRGPWIAEEYERDERSAQAFRDGWYYTGDIVVVDRYGTLKVVDRATDMIKSGGEWISSIELENALMDHPGIATAAVVATPHERWGERPVAFVVREPGVSDEELTAHLASRFPKFWLPDKFVTMTQIPVTSVGKFDKKRLRYAASSSDE